MKWAEAIGGWLRGRFGKSAGQRILIYGDSHTIAIAQALAYRETHPSEPLPRIELYRYLKLKEGKQIGDTDLDRFCTMIARLGPDDTVISVIGGNQYAVASTVRREPFYTIVTAGEAIIAGETGIIPYRAMKSYIASGVFNSDGPMLRKIRDATRAHVFHLLPPPPKADNDYIRRYHESRFAAEGLGEFAPHSPGLRLSCWQMQRDCLAELCEEIGVELLAPPAVTMDADGFLDPHYYGKDVTHANRRYGEQLLRQIAAKAVDAAPVSAMAA